MKVKQLNNKAKCLVVRPSALISKKYLRMLVYTTIYA